MRFADQVVVVTGASRGLGREIALGFAAEGAQVHVGFRARAEAAQQVVDEIQGGGGQAVALPIDVRDAASVDTALGALKRVDVLVNNAAIVANTPAIMMPTTEFDDVVQTNLSGAFYCCRAVLRAMAVARGGAIINVSSVAAIRAIPGQTAYAASKAGMLALTRVLSAEAAPRGIRVNAVVPGFLDVGMARNLPRAVAKDAHARVPMGRFGEASEVVEPVLFLASAAASYITGQALVVDGGLSQ